MCLHSNNSTSKLLHTIDKISQPTFSSSSSYYDYYYRYRSHLVFDIKKQPLSKLIKQLPQSICEVFVCNVMFQFDWIGLNLWRCASHRFERKEREREKNKFASAVGLNINIMYSNGFYLFCENENERVHKYNEK